MRSRSLPTVSVMRIAIQVSNLAAEINSPRTGAERTWPPNHYRQSKKDTLSTTTHLIGTLAEPEAVAEGISTYPTRSPRCDHLHGPGAFWPSSYLHWGRESIGSQRYPLTFREWELFRFWPLFPLALSPWWSVQASYGATHHSIKHPIYSMLLCCSVYRRFLSVIDALKSLVMYLRVCDCLVTQGVNPTIR